MALETVYERLYQSASKYICVIRYYNPTPVVVEYRGHQDKLYERDFAGEIFDKYPDLHPTDYGLVYCRDSNFAIGDRNWFLLEKCARNTLVDDSNPIPFDARYKKRHYRQNE